MDKVCNGKSNCDDGSDETEGKLILGEGCRKAAYHRRIVSSYSIVNSYTIIVLGCELYGPGCKSWLGQEHVKCLVSESLSLSDTIICTLPEFLPKNNGTVQEVFNSCRNCTIDSGHGWRCDNGFCISADKHRDGIPDCDDGSDEKQSKFSYIYRTTRYKKFSYKAKHDYARILYISI